MVMLTYNRRRKETEGTPMMPKEPILEEVTWQPPTQEELEEKALNYLKTCLPKDYRQMKKDGELEENIRLRVKAAKSYAESLIKGGMFEGEAWNLAIRQEILDSESD
jgi:hypothetical protein